MAVFLSRGWSPRKSDTISFESCKKSVIKCGGMDPNRVFVVRSDPKLDRLKILPPVESLKKGRKYLVGYVVGMGHTTLGKPILQVDLTEGRFSAQQASLYACRNDVVDLVEKILYRLDRPEKRVKIGKFGE